LLRRQSGTSLAEGCGERFRAIAGADVGHDPFDVDAKTTGPGERAFGKAFASLRAWKRLDIGKPRGIIDFDMQIV
jgi:hypothetical protein